MQLTDLPGTLARRWYLTLVGLLATAGLCVLTADLVEPTYATDASVVLLPPASSVGEGGNPYLYLGGLDQATDVVTRALTSDASRAEVRAAAGSGDYEVLPDWSTSGPILIVTGTGTTAQAAEAMRTAVLDRVPTTLVTLQQTLDVPDGSQITSMVLTADAKPAAVTKTRMRALAAAGVVGLVGTAMVVGLIDGLLATRVRRRARRAAQAAATARPAEPATPADHGATAPGPDPAATHGTATVHDAARDPAHGPAHDAATPTAGRSSVAELSRILDRPDVPRPARAPSHHHH